MKDLVEHLAQRSAVFLGEPPELAQHQAALGGGGHRIEHRRSESSPAFFHLATEASPNATWGRAWLVTVPAVLEADSCKPSTEFFTLDSQALSGSCGAFGTQQQNTDGTYTDSSMWLDSGFGSLRLGADYATQASRRHYTGHERDLDTGLDYMNARYSTATLARFQSVDPIRGKPASPQSWNRFAYVRNNPLNRIDPTGMQSDESRHSGSTEDKSGVKQRHYNRWIEDEQLEQKKKELEDQAKLHEESLDSQVEVCVRPIAILPRWLPWWASPANHTYVRIGDWAVGSQNTSEVIDEADPDHPGTSCWPARQVDIATLPDGQPCELALGNGIADCMREYADTGLASGAGHGEYNWVTNNCGDWLIRGLRQCCLEGKIPHHNYGPNSVGGEP